MSVKNSIYREPPTPSGLEKMEKGTLDYMETEVWSNLNTGVLEEYFEEKNHRESFERSKFVWKKIFIGIILGSLFAVITEYVGLKVGLAISGGWYIMALVGMILKWNPAEINIASSACNGATYISTGFIFTFPALYLLASQDKYAMGLDADGNKLYLIQSIPNNMVVIALVATILTGMLGILYFIILRRIWLVEDPLHVPGWEPQLQLIDIANDLYKSGGERSAQARHSINLVATWIAVTAGFTFLRDFPISGGKAALDMAFGSPWYGAGTLEIPKETQNYTAIGFGFIPMQIGIGWFMKFRVALLVNLGTFFTWWVVVPLAIAANTPVFDPLTTSFYSVSAFPILGAESGSMLQDSAAYAAFNNISRPIAVGAILGGGITGLLKMAPTFKSAFADIKTAGKGDGEGNAGGYIQGKGWFEWPASHIKLVMILTVIFIPILFVRGGLDPMASIIFAIILVGTTFFLGAIAVKVMGETGTEPVSGTSFIVLLLLVLLFVGLGLPPAMIAIMALLGTTLFAGSISMSGDIILDFKTGHYIGNRPYHIVKAVLTAIIPGAIASVLGAIMFSTLLAEGKMDLAAPQANAFAMMTRALVGRETLAMIGGYIMIGVVIGVLAEFTTGMGTAFGLGMYFPLYLFLPMIVGGLLRDVWERKRLEPMVEAENLNEKEKTMKVLDTYMIATGLIIGEAIMGTAVAIYYMFS